MSGALGLNWQDAACQVKSQKKSDNMDTVRARECKQKTKRFDIILLNEKRILDMRLYCRVCITNRFEGCFS